MRAGVVGAEAGFTMGVAVLLSSITILHWWVRSGVASCLLLSLACQGSWTGPELAASMSLVGSWCRSHPVCVCTLCMLARLPAAALPAALSSCKETCSPAALAAGSTPPQGAPACRCAHMLEGVLT